jgi:hypothetical protein
VGSYGQTMYVLSHPSRLLLMTRVMASCSNWETGNDGATRGRNKTDGPISSFFVSDVGCRQSYHVHMWPWERWESVDGVPLVSRLSVCLQDMYHMSAWGQVGEVCRCLPKVKSC